MSNSKDAPSVAALSLYWALSVLAVLSGPIPLAYFVSAGTSEFEGARGFAVIALIPVIAIVLALVFIVLFFAVRKNFPLCKKATWSIGAFVLVCAFSLTWMGQGL